MRLTDLRDKKVRSLDGETLGRVHEVHTEGGKVIAFMCGPGSFIERWTARKEGRRIPWEFVKRIEAEPADMAEVRKRVEGELFRQKADQVMERYLADLKEKTTIRVHRALLPFKYVGEYKS